MRLYILCLLIGILTACATTVPTIEEGWVPLDEWNHRIVHSNPLASFAESIAGSRIVGGNTTVLTYCTSYRHYTRCSSY